MNSSDVSYLLRGVKRTLPQRVSVIARNVLNGWVQPQDFIDDGFYAWPRVLDFERTELLLGGILAEI
jgi:hypothetical protein